MKCLLAQRSNNQMVITERRLCQYLKKLYAGRRNFFDAYNAAIAKIVFGMMATAETKLRFQFPNFRYQLLVPTT